MEAEDASWESMARSPNSFFRRASCEERLHCQFWPKKGVGSVSPDGALGTQTRYVLGSWGMRFRMRVVLPLPRKPVIIVTGTGVMFAGEKSVDGLWDPSCGLHRSGRG